MCMRGERLARSRLIVRFDANALNHNLRTGGQRNIMNGSDG